MTRQRPSKTARKVALNVLALGSKPSLDEVLPPGIVDATARLLIAEGVVGRRAVRLARSRCAVAIYEALDWMMPGQFEAFAHRKAFCERQVKDGLLAGATQVLVLGCGHDTLGWRLAPEFPSVGFFEVDHPATARLKVAGISNLGRRKNLHVIEAHLGDRRLVDVLTSNGSWNTTVTSVIVAEGLLQYLPPDAVRNLFEQCAAVAPAGSRLAFTYIGAGADGRPDVGRWTWLVLRILKLSGEPWRWSIRPEDLPHLLRETGWKEPADLTGGACKIGVEYFSAAVRQAPSTHLADS